MAKAVIFDLFHTLTAPEAEWSDLPWTSDVLGISRADWYRALTVNSRQRLVGEISDPLEIVRLIAHSIDPGISQDLIARAAAFRTKRFIRVLSSIPTSTLHVLRELRSRGVRLGLVSNCDCSEVSAWADSPLQGAFDAEVFSCHVGFAKPEPEIYLECLRRLGMNAAKAVFVGDGGSNELRGRAKLECAQFYFRVSSRKCGRSAFLNWPRAQTLMSRVLMRWSRILYSGSRTSERRRWKVRPNLSLNPGAG